MDPSVQMIPLESKWYAIEVKGEASKGHPYSWTCKCFHLRESLQYGRDSLEGGFVRVHV